MEMRKRIWSWLERNVWGSLLERVSLSRLWNTQLVAEALYLKGSQVSKSRLWNGWAGGPVQVSAKSKVSVSTGRALENGGWRDGKGGNPRHAADREKGASGVGSNEVSSERKGWGGVEWGINWERVTDKLGVWDWHTYTAIYKTENQ